MLLPPPRPFLWRIGPSCLSTQKTPPGDFPAGFYNGIRKTPFVNRPSPHLAAHLKTLQSVYRLGTSRYMVFQICFFRLSLLLLPALKEQPVGTGFVASLLIIGTGFLTRQHGVHHSSMKSKQKDPLPPLVGPPVVFSIVHSPSHSHLTLVKFLCTLRVPLFHPFFSISPLHVALFPFWQYNDESISLKEGNPTLEHTRQNCAF